MRLESTDAEALARLEDVVARHLVRSAFREPVAVEWVGGSDVRPTASQAAAPDTNPQAAGPADPARRRRLTRT
jgi:hypothetical protein